MVQPQRSLEQQLPRYTKAQEERRALIMAKIAAETVALRLKLAPYERELSDIERAALT